MGRARNASAASATVMTCRTGDRRKRIAEYVKSSLRARRRALRALVRPHGRCHGSVLGAVAQFERSTIVNRLQRGRKAKAAQGGYAFGAPGFGSKALGGALVANGDEADTVARIVELRRAGKSLREIGAELVAEGRTTKRGATSWPPSTIGRILKRAATN